jgi:hypothetical protein
MKNLFLTLMLVAGMHAVSAKAGLGWTLAECREHYKTEGTPSGKDDLGLDEYTFNAQNYDINVAFDSIGKAISIRYMTAVFDDEEIDKILANNAPHVTWYKEDEGSSTDHSKPVYWTGVEKTGNQKGVRTFFAVLTQVTMFGSMVQKLQVSTVAIETLIAQQRKASDL